MGTGGKKDLDSLRSEIYRLWAGDLRVRDGMAGLEGQMSLFIKLFIAFNVPTLVGIIGILLGLTARYLVRSGSCRGLARVLLSIAD